MTKNVEMGLLTQGKLVEIVLLIPDLANLFVEIVLVKSVNQPLTVLPTVRQLTKNVEMGLLTQGRIVLPVLQILNRANLQIVAVMEAVELMIVNIVFPTVIPLISVSPTVSRMEKKTRSKLATLLI
ncbi:MAG: hypothetical protein LBD75_05450 [Candidatus Peribacteria bacterium]|nr:hypothetical protein [Candidatus Peribacteria bacterium]